MKQKHDNLAHKAGVLALITIPFLGLIAGLIIGADLVSFLLFGALSALTILGVTVGFHRLATHKSFETYGWVKFIFLALGSMTGQGRIDTDWGPMHIYHHVTSDGHDDLHSPMKGFLHSHLWWMFASNPAPYARFEKELAKDPVVVSVGRLFLFWVFIGFIFPALVDLLFVGTIKSFFMGFLWGGLIRMFFVNHVTWSVNSICHMFGTQSYDTGDDSRNNAIVGILALGEGWHNNHHAFQKSARHGLSPWQVDVSYGVIKTLELCRLAWNVDRFVPTPEIIALRRIRV